jgi:hypothetical protein
MQHGRLCCRKITQRCSCSLHTFTFAALPETFASLKLEVNVLKAMMLQTNAEGCLQMLPCSRSYGVAEHSLALAAM